MFFEWKNNGKTVLGSSEFIPSDVVSTLAKDGVRLSQKSTMTPLDYFVEVNKLISDRINNCKQVLPDWIRWDYVKDLFIMNNGKTTSEVKTELDGIKEYAIRYPFQRYINWNFGGNDGNILKNDKKFCVLLYEKNFDIFSEYNKVTDVRKKVKGNIYEFLASGSKIDMVVDAGVLCCYLDDFNSSGESEKLRNDILLKYIDAALEKQQFNLKDIFKESLKILRINLDDVNRKQFYEKQLRNLQMNIDENGNVKFERKKK